MRLHRQEDFWRAHLRAPAPHVHPAARAMLNQLLAVDPRRRASPAEVLLDPWFHSGGIDKRQGDREGEDVTAYVNHFARVAGHVQKQTEKDMEAAVAMAETSATQEVVFNACVARSARLTLEDDEDADGTAEKKASSEVIARDDYGDEEVYEDKEEATSHEHSWEADAISNVPLVTRKHSLILASGNRTSKHLLAGVRAALIAAGATVTQTVGLVFNATFGNSNDNDDVQRPPRDMNNAVSEPRLLQLPQPPANTTNNNVTIKNLELEIRLSPHKAASKVKQEVRPHPGVWVLEGSRCGIGDVWSLALAWRTVLLALSASGSPEATSALQAGASRSPAGTADHGGWQEPSSDWSPQAANALLGLMAPRLPPPSDDDPTYNSFLRVAPSAADCTVSSESEPAIPSVLADASDEVF